MTPLTHLKEGDRAIIKKIGGNGVFRQRLLEMGFQTGEILTIEKYAPLKDPIEFVIMDYHVSLRCDEAKHIWVEKINRHHRRHRKRHRRRGV